MLLLEYYHILTSYVCYDNGVDLSSQYHNTSVWLLVLSNKVNKSYQSQTLFEELNVDMIIKYLNTDILFKHDSGKVNWHE